MREQSSMTYLKAYLSWMTVNPTFSSCTKQGIIRCCHRKLNTDKNGTRHFSLHLLPSFVRIRTYSCFSVYFCAIGHWLATIDRSGVGGTSLLRFPACGWRPVVRGTPRGRGKELMHTRRYTVGGGGAAYAHTGAMRFWRCFRIINTKQKSLGAVMEWNLKCEESYLSKARFLCKL